MKDDDFSDWRREDEPPPREPDEPRDIQIRPAEIEAQAITCPVCRYNLTGVTIGTPCPECGVMVGAGMLGANVLPTSARAIASLVLGIIGLLGCCFYGLSGIACGGVAVFLARGVKESVVRGEVHPSSQGLAMAGFVCGLIGLILGLTTLGLIVAAFALNW